MSKIAVPIPKAYLSDDGSVNLDRMIVDVIAVTKIGGFTQEALITRIKDVWPEVELFPVAGNA